MECVEVVCASCAVCSARWCAAGTSQRDVPTYDEDAAAQRPYLKPIAARSPYPERPVGMACCAVPAWFEADSIECRRAVW